MTRIVVTVDDAYVDKIHDIADALRARGMTIDSVMEAVGLIAGRYDKALSTLERIGGVKAVEAQAGIKLPPPGADVQ